MIRSNAREVGRARPSHTTYRIPQRFILRPLRNLREESALSELQFLKSHWDSIGWDRRDDGGRDRQGD